MDLAEEVRELRKTVGNMADMLTRVGVGGFVAQMA